MNAETTSSVYPGNPSLPREVKEKILSTFRHTLNLFYEGKLDDCLIGCDFILKMDARFAPARQLLEKARNPASAVDVAQLEAIVATTPTRQERVVAADPDRLLVRAVESFNARDFDAAISAAEQVLEVLPGNQDALEILDKATRKKSGAAGVRRLAGARPGRPRVQPEGRRAPRARQDARPRPGPSGRRAARAADRPPRPRRRRREPSRTRSLRRRRTSADWISIFRRSRRPAGSERRRASRRSSSTTTRPWR